MSRTGSSDPQVTGPDGDFHGQPSGFQMPMTLPYSRRWSPHLCRQTPAPERGNRCLASACSRLGRRRARARMPRAGSVETRGDRGGQPASACLWGGAAYARAQKGQRGPAESWRERCGAGAQVGARRGRGGWTRGVGVSLSSRADRRHGQTERGDTGGAWCLGRSVLGGSGGWCSRAWCVRRARVSDPFGQARPS